jgi:hypothetical protein
MYLALALPRRHVWCNVHRNIHLFTRQMFSVPAVKKYELPHAKIFNAALCVWWFRSVRVCLISFEAVNYAQTNVTFLAEIKHAPGLLLQRTHATPALFSFGMPMLWILYFQSTELGGKWCWSTVWNATICQIFFMRMDNKFANEKFTEMFESFCRHMTCG